MKGTAGALLQAPSDHRVPDVVDRATSVTSAGASSVTTTTAASGQKVCGVGGDSFVHVVSKGSPCENLPSTRRSTFESNFVRDTDGLSGQATRERSW